MLEQLADQRKGLRTTGLYELTFLSFIGNLAQIRRVDQPLFIAA